MLHRRSPAMFMSLDQDELAIFNTLQNQFDESVSRRRRSISFADENGGELLQTRLITSNPYDTPVLGSPYARAVDRVTPKGVDKSELIGSYELNVITNDVDLVKHPVQLETVSIATNSLLDVNGTVKVANLHYHKEVVIRLTTNHWRTFVDYGSRYLSQYHTVGHDTFAFVIVLSPFALDSIEFCVRCRMGGEEFWDNNCGRNYHFTVEKLFAQQTPPTLEKPKIVKPTDNFSSRGWEIGRW